MRASKHFGKLQAVDEGTFGLDPGTGYVDIDVHPQSVSMPINRIMHEDPSWRQGCYDLARIPGGVSEPFPVEGDLSFKMKWHGHSTSIPEAAPSTLSRLWNFFVAAMGKKYAAGYEVEGIDTGSTTALLKGVDWASMRAGQMIAILAAAKYSARFIQTVDETTTPQEASPATGILYHGAALATTPWWGSMCAIHSDEFGADAKSQTFMIHLPSGKASPAVIARTFVGCRPRSFVIRGDLRGLCEVEFVWAVGGEMLPIAGSLTALSYAYPPPNTLADAYCYLTDGSTAHRVVGSSFELTYENDLKMVGDINASTGVAEWEKGMVTAQLTLNPYFDDDLWRPYHWAQTVLDGQVIVGHQPGRFCGIHMPGGLLTALDQEADRDTQMANAITLNMGAYAGDVHDDGASGRTDGTVDSRLTLGSA